MMTYALLNGLVLVAIGIFLALRRPCLPWRRLAAVMLILLVCTMVFDSLIVGSGIVAYDAAKILQVYIIKAPLEDFAYTIAAGLLVPYLWEQQQPTKAHNSKHDPSH